jgi:hypothetical protein
MRILYLVLGKYLSSQFTVQISSSKQFSSLSRQHQLRLRNQSIAATLTMVSPATASLTNQRVSALWFYQTGLCLEPRVQHSPYPTSDRFVRPSLVFSLYLYTGIYSLLHLTQKRRPRRTTSSANCHTNFHQANWIYTSVDDSQRPTTLARLCLAPETAALVSSPPYRLVLTAVYCSSREVWTGKSEQWPLESDILDRSAHGGEHGSLP